MATLNGWKAIAGHLKRDERTARRWAAEGGMPVHRIPGPGRGSVYALAEEIDAWLATDRARVAEAARSAPVTIDVVPIVKFCPSSWVGRRWVAGALTAAGAFLVVAGMLQSRQPWAEPATPAVILADPATKAVYLQAGYDWNLRTPDSLARAVQEYAETIKRDPRVAPAYAGLANSYLLLREFGSLPDAAAYPRAEAAARAAVSLSPNCTEAHRALAFIAFWWHRDTATAAREFDRALVLSTNDALTYHWRANALLANGEVEAAQRDIERARDLDPTSTAILVDRGMILYIAGHRAEGLASLRVLAREQPEAAGPHRSLAEIAMFEGRQNEFLGESARAAYRRSDAPLLAKIERWRFAAMQAGQLNNAMLIDAKQGKEGWFQVARVASVAGRFGEAKDALARACNAGEPDTVSAPSDLWLSRAMTPSDIAARCGATSSLL